MSTKQVKPAPQDSSPDEVIEAGRNVTNPMSSGVRASGDNKTVSDEDVEGGSEPPIKIASEDPSVCCLWRWCCSKPSSEDLATKKPFYPQGLCMTHQEVWEKLVQAEGDCVEYYLYPYSCLVYLACNPWWVGLGISCAIWAGVIEMLTAAVKRSYTIGYGTGAACFALVVRPTRDRALRRMLRACLF
jgi:hypothetical protein